MPNLPTILQDSLTKTIYATDASAYRELPHGAAIPKTEEDIKALLAYCREKKIGLIARGAGTSLAGQVVGDGLVVDFSKHFTKILEINPKEKWARIQPGVNRDELNMALKEHGLMFGPETSTSNRCRIGGMVGNNSCGSNSVKFGSTREHLLEARCLLSDGSEVWFKPLSKHEFLDKVEGRSAKGLEQDIYKKLYAVLSNEDNQQEISAQFPKPSVTRRNTGYALDLLLDNEVFSASDKPFNLCTLLAGSEGTLAIILELKLKLVDVKPRHTALICGHFHSVKESLQANLIGLKYEPWASELMDDHVLQATKANLEQRKNRFFVQGDPEAVLMVELNGEDHEEVQARANAMVQEMKETGLGYHYPIIWNEDTKAAWELRKAGLGLLGNIPGDEKAVPVIEDTAVDVQDLPEYIEEFNQIMKSYGKKCVHYAHAGSGELHLRPLLNLKTEEGNKLFKEILHEVALLVKKYKGSLSGEHGDGRLRGEFIPLMIGERNMQLLREVKQAFDPEGLLNPGKIVATPSMNEQLRYSPGQITPEFETYFAYDETQGFMRMAENCNGSGDCRKSHLIGGTMCPSYMATKNEKDTTRARANVLREFLTRPKQDNPFAHQEIKEAMDLCLSCKGCKSECPSNVDIGKMKAEWQQHYHDEVGIPFRSWLIGNFTLLNKLSQPFFPIYNSLLGEHTIGKKMKSLLGFHPERTLPRLSSKTFRAWFKTNAAALQPNKPQGKVVLLADEFTNYQDQHVGIATTKLLTSLGYEVTLSPIKETGRSAFSKGMLRYGRQLAESNIHKLDSIISDEIPLVGIEPSALLCFRDEYPDLVTDGLRKKALVLRENCLLLEEFLEKEMIKGKVHCEQFTKEKRTIYFHGHCMQKALSSMTSCRKVLSLPKNYAFRLIPSGCCGMAGSFGYEKEHYEVSMQIGELVLLPSARKLQKGEILCASGTSCRHQIKDGTGVKSLHPAEVLLEALKRSENPN